MENTNNNLKGKLQARFNGQEEELPAGLWPKIEAKLEKRRRTFLPVWFWYVGVGLLTLAGLGLVLKHSGSIFNPDETLSTKNTTVSNRALALNEKSGLVIKDKPMHLANPKNSFGGAEIDGNTHPSKGNEKSGYNEGFLSKSEIKKPLSIINTENQVQGASQRQPILNSKSKSSIIAKSINSGIYPGFNKPLPKARRNRNKLKGTETNRDFLASETPITSRNLLDQTHNSVELNLGTEKVTLPTDSLKALINSDSIKPRNFVSDSVQKNYYNYPKSDSFSVVKSNSPFTIASLWAETGLNYQIITLAGGNNLEFTGAKMPERISSRRLSYGFGINYAVFERKRSRLLIIAGLKYQHREMTLLAQSIQPGERIISPDSNSVVYVNATIAQNYTLSQDLFWLQTGADFQINLTGKLYLSGQTLFNTNLNQNNNGPVFGRPVNNFEIRPSLGFNGVSWSVFAGPQWFIPVQKQTDSGVKIGSSGFAIRIAKRLVK